MHPGDEAPWIDLGAVDDVTDRPRRLEVDGTSVVAARLGDEVLVAVDRCPHRGAPLSAGTVRDDCLVCPYHGWEFDATGAVTGIPALGRGATLPSRARLRTATVDERDGRVQVAPGSVAAAEPPRRSVANDDPALRAGWHPVCRSDEVAHDGSVEVSLLAAQWLLRRTAAGVLECDGAHDVADHLGHVWLAPDEPFADLLEVAEFGEPGWQRVPMPRVEGRYGMGLLLDNQLDAGHFPFVHRTTFGSAVAEALASYEVERDGFGFEVRLRVPISARNDVNRSGDGSGIAQHRNMTYRYRAPSTLFLRLDYEEMGGSTGILFCFTPLDAQSTRMDVDLLFRHPAGFTEEQLAERLAFEIAVVAEDLALQDLFEFLELPLDLTAEVHTRADRSAVEMRRILGGFYA